MNRPPNTLVPLVQTISNVNFLGWWEIYLSFNGSLQFWEQEKVVEA